jgi:hypothetical protein
VNAAVRILKRNEELHAVLYRRSETQT